MTFPVMIPSESGATVVKEAVYRDRRVRVWVNNGAWHSAVFTDSRYRYEPVFTYEQKFDLAFRLNGDIRDVLMIGAGMYTYPASVLHRFTDTEVTAVDIDPSLLETAEKYFFLDEADRRDHLHAVFEDGRRYLEDTDAVYDLIVFDAFEGTVPACKLVTEEAACLYREHLTERGILVMNLPGRIVFEESDFLYDELNTLHTVFNCVRAVSAEGEGAGDRCNYVVFASMTDIYPEGMLEYDLSQTVILKDRDASHFMEFYEL